MKKISHLAIALFSATSLTTSIFAGRGSEEPAPVPVVPIVTPIPQDPADVPDMNDDDQNDDQNNNQQQGFSSGQMAAAGIGGAAAALAIGGAAAGVMKGKSNMKKAEVIVKHRELESIRNSEQFSSIANHDPIANKMLEVSKNASSAKTPEEKVKHLDTLTMLKSHEHATAAHQTLADHLTEKVNEPPRKLTKTERAKSIIRPEKVAREHVL